RIFWRILSRRKTRKSPHCDRRSRRDGAGRSGMASLLEIIGEALVTYWSAPLPLAVIAVIAVCGASMGTLLYVFLTNARNAKLRVSLLTGLYGMSIFFWAFVATSILLCIGQARMVAYARTGGPLAVSGAVAAGLGSSA